MRIRSLAFLTAALGWLAAQGQRLAHARRLGRRRPDVLQLANAGARTRVLVIGDSTGAGVGCDDPTASVAARLAAEHGAHVDNLCRTGATIGQVLDCGMHLSPPPVRYDLALVFAGANDVLRRTPPRVLAAQAAALLAELRLCATQVIWVGVANVGLAPAFLPPLSWWLSRRVRLVNRIIAHAAREHGADFVEFHRNASHDPAVREPRRFYARDGVHPSADAHAWCYARMRPRLAKALAR